MMQFTKGQSINVNGRQYLVVEVKEVNHQILIYIVNKRGKTLKYVIYNPEHNVFSNEYSTFSKVTNEEIIELEEAAKQSQAIIESKEVELIQPETQGDQSETIEAEISNQLIEAESQLLFHKSEVEKLENKINKLKAKSIKESEILTITLTRNEGRCEECGTVCVTSWVDAEETLCNWAKTAPGEGQGYHKCDIVLTFDDGESFRVRFDLQQKHLFCLNLGHEVMRELNFLAGNCPDHLTEEQYYTFLKFCKIDTKQYRQFIDSHVIPA